MLGRKSESKLNRKTILQRFQYRALFRCASISTDSNNSNAAATGRNRYRSHGSLSELCYAALSTCVSQTYVRHLRVIMLRAQVRNSTPQFSVFFRPPGCGATSSDAETDLIQSSASITRPTLPIQLPTAKCYSSSGVQAILTGATLARTSTSSSEFLFNV